MRNLKNLKNLRIEQGLARVMVAGCVLTGGLLAFQKADPAAFNGTWKLDVPASTNPNGPTQPPPAAKSARGPSAPGIGGGPESSGAAGTSGGGSGGGALGPEEKKRFYATLKVLEAGPTTLVIATTPTDVTLSADANKFHHLIGKSEKLQTGLGPLEVKAQWNGPGLKREIKTVDGLTVVETYTLAEGGKQLLVSLDLKSQVERLADYLKQPVKRVYHRAQ